jgi:MFS family permease
MAAPATTRVALPASIWALGGVSLLMDVSSELIHSLLPVFMVVGLGASAGLVGWVEGIAEATAMVVKVFSGALSDAWGRRKPFALLGYGLGAASKPLFALAGGVGWVLAARFIDRIGKGLRGAPRDALIADLTPPAMRGAAYGLRQSLDTVGAFLGPVLAIVLMVAFDDDFRTVFWFAVIPGALAVLLLALGVREPERPPAAVIERPWRREAMARLPRAYWTTVAVGAVFTLARFSEAFLLLRAQQAGLALAWTPLVLIGMNVVFALSAYPFGTLADRIDHRHLLAAGLAVLVAADLLLALGTSAWALAGGIALWGLHMGMTQGLLATMVAASAPATLRGTAFGVFNLASGVAVLVASVLAGWLWDRYGAPATFLAGAAFAMAALVALLWPRAARGGSGSMPAS